MTLELVNAPIALDDDIPASTKRVILEQEIQLYRNTRYQLEVRQRVQKRIGNTEAEAGVIKELEKIEQALDVLADELKSL